MDKKRYIKVKWENFLKWRRLHISDKQTMGILSFFVGVGCALAAFLLKFLIKTIHSFVNQGFTGGNLNYLYLITPIIGIAIASAFVHYVIKDDISHGVTKIMFAISQRKAYIRMHNMWSSVVASSFTIGFGGSVGAEAPIVLTGSAIGSQLGNLLHLDQKKMMLLVGCGATGAVAGIFKAPITGVIFTLEVLMLDLTMASIVPLIITAITATVITFALSGTENMFPFDTTVNFAPERTPYYILLGVVCGFVSLYFVRGSNKLESFFRSINSPMKKLAVGGVMLSLLIFFLPPLYGEGYDTITALINGQEELVTRNSVFYGFNDNFFMMFLFFFLVAFFKIFATAATNGSGGTGGIFAPSLFMGCVAGFTTAGTINSVSSTSLPEKNFALAGMAGVMSGVMHAPLTSTFLIAELTGGYGLFLSIMTTAVVAYMTILVFEPHSLYAMRLAQKGELMTHHIDKNIQMMLDVDSLIDKDLKELKPKMRLGEVIDVIKETKRNVFPVLDDHRCLVGILTINDIRNVMFQPEYYNTLQVEQFMLGASALIFVEDPEKKKMVEDEINKEREERDKKDQRTTPKQKQDEEDRLKDVQGDTVDAIMKKFEFTKAWNLAVVYKGSNKYVGFLSRAKVYNAYRDLLQQFSDE
jgi:CIC family chloride channel protein